MQYADWDYSRQGDFLRTDGLCNRDIVLEVDTPLAPVEPRTGLPTQFRSRTRHPFEMQSGCRAEGMSSCTGYGSFVVRTPDADTPDVIWMPIGGENWIQRLSDGGLARWISWPPPWQLANDTWFGLWRVEYPDGRIERFLQSIYDDANQAWAGYLAREKGSQGMRVLQADGSSILKDGGGRSYARVDGNRFIPFALAIGTARQTIEYESGFTGGRFRSLDWAVGGYEWAEQSTVWTDPQHAQLTTLSRLSKQAILALSAADVVKMYYSTGAWEVDDGNDWLLARYRGGLLPLTGTSVFLAETMIRQRLYQFRPGLHTVRLSDGNVVPGILDWAIFPPLDGIQCARKPPTGFGAILQQVLTIASTVMVAAIPGIGGLAIGLGMTYANAKDQGKLLADALRQAEAGGKYTQLVMGAQTGAFQIVATNPPDAAQAEQEARAAGEPFTRPPASNGLLIAAAIAAVLLA